MESHSLTEQRPPQEWTRMYDELWEEIPQKAETERKKKM
jgi:hypothetical protein